MHKLIDNIALNRTELDKRIGGSITLKPQEDITPPRVSYKTPYTLDKNKPGVQTLSEESKDL